MPLPVLLDLVNISCILKCLSPAVAYDLDYYGGYDPYYDAYAEDYDYYGYTGYEDYGYEDYDYYVPVATYPAPVVPAMPRARGRGLGLPGMAVSSVWIYVECTLF